MTEPRDYLQIGPAQLQLVRGRRAGSTPPGRTRGCRFLMLWHVYAV